ncbi:hypothetical protein INR49_011304 [Caranx melampygus]|nr:hypothetical protein INR49_011304 [Caranx melampygus]
MHACARGSSKCTTGIKVARCAPEEVVVCGSRGFPKYGPRAPREATNYDGLTIRTAPPLPLFFTSAGITTDSSLEWGSCRLGNSSFSPEGPER